VSDLVQGNRFELKYIIAESTARNVRDFARSYLLPDKYADQKRNNSYPVYSLYLDSPGRELYGSTVQGHKNRFKLRLRYYDEVDSHPVFFEIKRRVTDVILKDRAGVRRSSILPLLAGQWPTRNDLAPGSEKFYAALDRFCTLRALLKADGWAFVSYLREAYTSADGHVRVTFDREIAGARYRGVFKLPGADAWLHPPIGGVVLELKYTDRFPCWMSEMVRAMDLWRGPMAKYVATTTVPDGMDGFLAYEV
jgi:hypothetical protein